MKLAVRLAALGLTVVSGFALAADEDGDPAPPFRAHTLSGETFNNESVKGKVVLFEFWTTWCQYCHQEEALIEQIDKEFSSKGVIVLAVDVAESKKTVEKCLEQHPRACRIVLTFRITSRASGCITPLITGRPGLMMPAFSAAMLVSIVPSNCV